MVSKYNPHNMQRRENKKNAKIVQLKQQINLLKVRARRASLAYKRAGSSKSLAQYYKRKCNMLTECYVIVIPCPSRGVY